MQSKKTTNADTLRGPDDGNKKKEESFTKKNGMSRQEVATTLKRCMKFINAADRFHIGRELICDMIEIINEFLGIILAAFVIGGIINSKTLEEMLVLAGIVSASYLLLNLIERSIAGRENSHDFALDQNKQRFLWEKLMNMDYGKVEDSRTHTVFVEAVNMLKSERLGLPRLERNIRFTLAGGFYILVGLVLLLPITLQKPVVTKGITGFVQSGLGFAALILIVAFLEIVNTMYVNAKSMKLHAKQESHPQVLQASKEEDYYRSYVAFHYQSGKQLRIFDEQALFLEGYDRTVKSRVEIFREVWKKDIKYQFVWQMINILTRILMYGFAVYRSVTGMFTPDEVVAFALYFTKVQTGISNVSDGYGVLKLCVPFCKHIFDFLDIPDEKYEGSIPTEKRDDNEYEFAFRHVYFKYPGSKDYVLKDINLTWKIGEKMALVGRNGCGKSTLVKLLCRLYDPTEGEITLNGIDIRKYKYEDYIALFSVVFQDADVFSFPMAENVAADVSYDAERVTDCVSRAGLEERLQRMENGIETCLYKNFDENGVEISGGEVQKLCLARAVYKGAPFVILDEPTAALDPRAEYDMYTRFNEVVGTRTAVYISHRLSSCRFCDRITVMDEGKIVEQGSHEKLLEKDGVYKKLWSAQAEYYKERAGELYA